MPTTRRQSQPAQSPRSPAAGGTPDAGDSIASRVRTRASVTPTPTPILTPRGRGRGRTSMTPVHHKTADELAIEEAREILGGIVELGRNRNEAEDAAGGSGSIILGEEVPFSDNEADQNLETRSSGKITRNNEKSGNGTGEAGVLNDEAGGEEVEDAQSASEESSQVSSSSIMSGSAGVNSNSNSDSNSDSDSDSDSDDSESHSTSISEDDSGSDTDSDDDEDDLEALLAAAKAVAARKVDGTKESPATTGTAGEAQVEDEVVLQFEERDREKAERPVPDLAVRNIPIARLTFLENGSAKAYQPMPSVSGTGAGPSKRASATPSAVAAVAGSASAPEPELDNRPYERTISKREKARQPRKATASELWATLPSAKSELLPQMRRDYQALSLAASLDPKRFMKGGSRSGKIPEHFAIGTMVEAPRHLQDSTLIRERTYRPGQIVQSLTRDEGTGSYAKRKFEDLQGHRMDNGRGKGWKKRSK